MRFALMELVGGAVVRKSIFGVLDKDKPGRLPRLSQDSLWTEFGTIDDSRFKFANEAMMAIAERGYFLMGASVMVTEAFGGLK